MLIAFPVLPLLASPMVSPGRSSSARSIMYFAMRALIDPDGLRYSSLTQIPSTMISGVSPIASRTVPPARGTKPAAASLVAPAADRAPLMAFMTAPYAHMRLTTLICPPSALRRGSRGQARSLASSQGRPDSYPDERPDNRQTLETMARPTDLSRTSSAGQCLVDNTEQLGGSPLPG